MDPRNPRPVSRRDSTSLPAAVAKGNLPAFMAAFSRAAAAVPAEDVLIRPLVLRQDTSSLRFGSGDGPRPSVWFLRWGGWLLCVFAMALGGVALWQGWSSGGIVGRILSCAFAVVCGSMGLVGAVVIWPKLRRFLAWNDAWEREQTARMAWWNLGRRTLVFPDGSPELPWSALGRLQLRDLGGRLRLEACPADGGEGAVFLANYVPDDRKTVASHADDIAHLTGWRWAD